MRELVMGIDLATANARVLVSDFTGRILEVTSCPLPAPVRRNRRSRQRADYWSAVAGMVSQVMMQLGPLGRGLRALSVSGTSGSLVPTDDTGVPVGETSLYDDTAPASELRRLADIGVLVGASSPLARLAWLGRHEPAASYLHTSDVVNAALLAAPAPTDTSHALKEGVDLVHGIRDLPLLSKAGIDAERLPDVVYPGTDLGRVAPAVAADLGLPPDVRVIAGMTDGCTAQIAAGAVFPGSTVGVLGTTLVLKAVSPTNVTALDGVVYSHRAPDGYYWPGGASSAGGAAISAAFPEADLRAMDRAAREHGPAHQVRYPLAGTGERFPFRSSVATGFAINLARTTAPARDVDHYRALLEGVAFVERLGLATLENLGIETGDHRVVGGGSASAVWNAIRATALGQPVQRTARPQSAFGAAVLAAGSVSRENLRSVTGRMVRVVETVEPVAAEVGALDERYRLLIDQLERRGLMDATVNVDQSTCNGKKGTT